MNNDGHGALAPNQASTAADEKDPVCGMMVNPATAKHRAEHQGKPYFFCSAKCHDRFVAEPLKYTSPQSQSPDAGPPQPTKEGAVYTCPMHPQIRQPGPGSCPICGMALELASASATAEPNHELADMTRRFWIQGNRVKF